MIHSILTLGLSQVVTWVGSAALAIFLPRLLGDVSLGKLAFAFALVHLVGLLADLGSATYLTREIARNPSAARELTFSALALRIPLSLVAMLIAVSIGFLGDFDDITRKVVLIMCLSILLESMTTTILAALQGVHDMRTLAITSTVTKTVYAGLAVLALLSGAGPVKVAMGAIVSHLVGLGIAALALRRTLPLRPTVSTRLWKPILLGGLPFFVWQASHAIYAEIDTVLLAVMTRDSVVGWYSAAYRIVTIPAFVATIVMTVMFPVLSAAAAERDQFSLIARRALHYVAVFTLPMGLGIMALAPQIIAMFNYPASFDNSIAPMAILAPHLPLAALGTILATVLNTRDRHRAWAMTGVGAALVNPALNVVLIPMSEQTWSNGAIGAAIATTLTEVYLIVMAVMLLPRGVFDRGTVISMLRCGAAATVMLGPVWMLRDLPIVVPILAGAGTHIAACFAVGAITLADLRELNANVIRPRLRHAVPTPVGGTT